jgi:hypothetical protein
MDETVVVYGKDALAFAPGSAPPQRDLPDLDALADSLENALERDQREAVSSQFVD